VTNEATEEYLHVYQCIHVDLVFHSLWELVMNNAHI